MRGKQGAPIAEVFTFLSGLYFRGKIAYATAFARPARGTSGVFVISPTRSLVDARTRIYLDDLRQFAMVSIHKNDPNSLGADVQPHCDRASIGRIHTA